MSDPLATYACVAPAQPKKPERKDGTKQSILLTWSAPSDDGGCPILGYKLYRDSGSPLSTVTVQVDPADFVGKPFLNQHDVALTLADTGKLYRFIVTVFNNEGEKASNIGTFIIATVPDKPTSAPTVDLNESDGTKIKISIDEFTTLMNGGADILSYEIQMDDGNNGPYRTVLGGETYTLDSEILITEGIIKGRTYRLRYRATNIIGYGDFSDVAYVVASTNPKAPPKPQYIYVDQTKVDLILSET